MDIGVVNRCHGLIEVILSPKVSTVDTFGDIIGVLAMMRRCPVDAVEALESLELLGADQWGLVTSAQAQENGISKVWLQRLNARGVLQRLKARGLCPAVISARAPPGCSGSLAERFDHHPRTRE